MKNGEPILLDEFNLCSESVLINLLPILKANINEKIYLKGVPEQIYISPGFILIATGNSYKEKGRNIISSIITDEINILEIKNIELKENKDLIENILVNEYNQIYQPNNSFDQYKISPQQIIQIVDALKSIVQFKLSLRHIKCFLERITSFCLDEINNEIEGLKRIPVIYVIISYIIPKLKIGRKLLELLEKFDSIMNYNNFNEIKEFIKPKVIFETLFIKKEEKEEKIKYIKKGKIFLVTKMNEGILPEVTLQVFFWIRMSCSLKSELPSEENLLLAGTTCYKEFILNTWLSLKLQKEQLIDTFFLTKNTEIESLIGTSSLDDEKKLEQQINNLIDYTFDYFNLDTNDLKNDEDYKEKFEIIKNNINKNNTCIYYIYESILKLKHLKESFNKNNDQIGLKTVISFNLGIIPIFFVFGKKLILKGIEHPEPSVLERLNSILENPRYLFLSEDNQEIFNEDKSFKKNYNSNKKTIPSNPSFSLFFTSREVFHGRLS